MASLTSCMKKAGKALRDEDRADILARFNALTEAGTATAEAARMAVDEQIDKVHGLLGDEPAGTTDAQRQQAADHAKDLGGRVVWQRGDLALVEGYSMLSGDSVYIAAKGSQRTRVDIKSFTGAGYTEAEKAELMKARADAVRAADELLARNPDGPFADGAVVFADDIPAAVQGVVRGWIGLLGLDSARIVVTTPASGAAMADGMAGKFRRIGKASLSGDNTNGTMQPLGGDDFHIAVRPGVSTLKALEVMAHELGHIVERRAFAQASAGTQQAIRDAHAAWLKENGSGRALDMAQAMRAYRTGQTTGFSEDAKAMEAGAYWRSFGEWFADQVSRWATTQDRPVGVVEQFFKRLADRLRVFFTGERAKFKPDATVAQWLDSLAKDVPPIEAASQPENDRNHFTLERGIGNNTLEKVTFARGEYITYQIGEGGKWAFGEIDGISHAKREFSVDGLWHPFGFAYKAERPAPVPKQGTEPLSKTVDRINAKYGAGLGPADAVSPVDAFKAVMQAVYDGKATVEDFQAGYARVRDENAIKAELGKMTKDELTRMFGIMREGKKDELVAMAYASMLRNFAMGKEYGPSGGYMMTRNGMADYEAKKRAALDELVAGQTADDLAAFAAEQDRISKERAGKRAALVESVKDPKTLDDFRNYERLKLSEGMSGEQARMSLTPEQRALRDELAAEMTRGRRKESTNEQRTTVRAAGQTTAGEIIATKHTRDGHDLWVVKLSDRVSKEDYVTLLAGAKRLGGNYSSFRGNGAVPGFQFRTPDAAQAFLKLAGGDTAAATEVAQERRNAFEDDRSQSASERLTEMADRLEERADESMGRDRKANTDRRARFAASAEASARADKAMATTMRNIAGAIGQGGAKFLGRVRQKVQVELLQTYVANGRDALLRAKYPTYAEQERHKGEAPTIEAADYAEFPTFTAYRSDLASLGRQLLEVDGTKKLGERIMKVADDVSDAFTAFAKEPGNLFRLSTFSVRAGDEVRTAIFPTREGAERAITRSGLSGKAIVFPEKRGVNRIIMSPSEAMARGIWKGDGDKRITLTDEFGNELVEKIGRVSRRGAKVSVPWQFERTYDRRKQLARMGIETPAEFRAALREFIAMREQPAEADKIKAMERAMIGRRNDGLDFFPTPESVADEMVAAADIQPGMRVLEPSAGMGHIAERIRAAGFDPDLGEISSDRRELLEAKGFIVKGRDFMDMAVAASAPTVSREEMAGIYEFREAVRGDVLDTVRTALYFFDRGDIDGAATMMARATRQAEFNEPAKAKFGDIVQRLEAQAAGGYDRILMNPPFSDGRDIQHVRHAYGLLKPGGRVVAIMGESAFFNQNKRATEFREWLDSVGGTSEKLPEGTFNDPSLPVQTGANARMVVIEKPAGEQAGDGAAQFSRAPGRSVELEAADAVGREFWRKIDNGESFTDQEVLDALSINRRGSRRLARGMRSVADQAGTGTAAVSWEGDLASFGAYTSRASWDGDNFNVFFIPDSIAGGADLNDDAQARDMALVHVSFKSALGGSYELSLNDPQPGTAAHSAAEAAGISAQVGTDSKRYTQIALSYGDVTSRMVLQEAARRLALNIGRTPDVMYAGRDTGARTGKNTGPVQYSADTLRNKFSRAPGARAGVPIADAEAVADAIRAAYPTGPQILVLDDVRKAPEALLDQIKNAQAANTVEGAYWKGKIYLFPQNVADIQRLMFVGAHHEIRHAGLDALFGKRKNALMLSLFLSNPKLADAARKKMVEINTDSKVLATEEALADMPLEDMAKLNGWNKIVAAVRQWLRGMADKLQRNHPKLAAMIRPDEWTDNDVAALIRRAEDISRGGTVPARPGGAVFSLDAEGRADQTQTPAFRRWFGDSKVVDAQGKPLVVYHGTRRNFTAFSPGNAQGWGTGIYLTDNAQEAAEYGDNVMPLYVSLQNPWIEGQSPSPDATGTKAWAKYLKDRGASADPDSDNYVSMDVALAEDGDLMNQVLREFGYDGIIAKLQSGQPGQEIVAFRPEQIKSALGNSGAFSPDTADIRFSRSAGTAKTTAPDWITSGSAALQGAAGKIDTYAPQKTMMEKAREMSAGWQQKLVQGMFDAYAPLKALSMDAYIAARMTKAADGAFEGMLMYGKPVMNADGGITGDLDGKGFLGAMRELNGEHDRFFMWLAGNRAERLYNETTGWTVRYTAPTGTEVVRNFEANEEAEKDAHVAKYAGAQVTRHKRENLFEPDEIAAMKALNRGTMDDGRPRIAAFKRALDEFNTYSKSVLDVAEKAGLIDGESRKLWEHDFYVPFYRMSQENEISGPTKIKGLVRQKAFERLKGGTENLGDLMDNTLRNWSHLLSASLANVAASKSLLAAEQAGIAIEAKEAQAKEMAKAAGLKGNATYFMDQGMQRWFVVEDPAILAAISSMEAPALNGLPLQLMAKFKKYLTVGVTIAPAFKVRNLIRDTLAAPAANEMSFNIAKNLAQGWKATDTKTDGYAQMLFSGGLMRFGNYLEGDRAEHVKQLIAAGVDDKTILNTPQKVKAMFVKAWDAWQDFGDRMENVNRTALYQQLLDKGVSPREAAYQARDMMDFSLQGSWAATRTLTAVIPFLNARAQGLYRLGRAASENPKRMGYMVAAVSLASIILMLAYEDDEDWKAREDWDRDGWWWFKIGDTAYRIPKPFEIGAMGTIAERSLELVINDEMTGARFAERMKQMVTGTFAINPVPQMFKPMLDLYANKDSFTGRQIETLGMERLSKAERYGPNTTALAKALGSAGEYTGISPVQVDHLIRAYFGWLGTMGAATVDAAVMPFEDFDRPAKKIDDYFGGFVKELPAASSRYLEDFYKQAQATSEAMADLRRAREVGDTEKAAEIMEERGDKLAQYRIYQQAQRQLADLNKRIRIVRGSTELDADTKRLRLDELTELRNRIARQVNDRTRAREAVLQ